MAERRLSAFAFVAASRGGRVGRYRAVNALRHRRLGDLWRHFAARIAAEGWG